MQKTLQHPPLPPSSATTVILSAAKNPEKLSTSAQLLINQLLCHQPQSS